MSFATTAPLGLIPDEPEADYRKSGCIGSTILNDYVESPEGCYHRHVLKDPDWQFNATAATDLGRLVHLFNECHGNFKAIATRVSVCPDEFMTDAGKVSKSKKALEWANTQESKLIISPEEYTKGMFLWKRAMANPVMANLLEGCQSEVTMRVRDPSTGLPVQIRIDALQPWGRMDLKSTSLPLEKLKYAIRDYGMCLQAALYGLVDMAVTKFDRPHYWGFIQTVYPYQTFVVQATEAQLASGTEKMNDALDGIAAGRWGIIQSEPKFIEDI